MKNNKSISYLTSSKYWLILTLVLGGIFLINYWIPLFADDYPYHFIYGTNTRISTLYDVIISQYKHYLNWGGRSIAHGILQILLINDQPINLALFKTAGLALLGYLIYYLAYNKFSLAPERLLTIIIVYWVFHPDLGECNFWLTGSCNYLIGPLLGLIYLSFFNKFQEYNYKKLPIIYFLSWAIAAFLAGWSNENYSIALFFLTVYFLYKSYKVNKTLSPYLLIISFIFTISMLFLLFAPGNKVRYDSFSQWHHHNFWYRYGENILFFLRGELIQIFIIIAFRYLYLKSPNTNKRELALAFFLASLIADAVMILTPTFAYRTLSSGYILKLVAVFMLYDFKIDLKLKPILALICLIFLIEFSYALHGYYKLFLENQNRLSLIQSSSKDEPLNLPLFTFKEHSKAIIFVRDIQEDKDYWTNSSIAKFYGFKQGIVGIKQ